VSAVCRCTAGPGGPTSGGAARAASAGTVVAGSGATGDGAIGDGAAGSGATGSGAATGTSLPTRTCDHGTNGPRNGGAASGGRGAVYGSGVHVGRTSSGRCAG
jgi:pilus assembly protein FimV